MSPKRNKDPAGSLLRDKPFGAAHEVVREDCLDLRLMRGIARFSRVAALRQVETEPCQAFALSDSTHRFCLRWGEGYEHG